MAAAPRQANSPPAVLILRRTPACKTQSAAEEPDEPAADEPEASVADEPDEPVADEAEPLVANVPEEPVADDEEPEAVDEPEKCVADEPMALVADEPEAPSQGRAKGSYGSDTIHIRSRRTNRIVTNSRCTKGNYFLRSRRTFVERSNNDLHRRLQQVCYLSCLQHTSE